MVALREGPDDEPALYFSGKRLVFTVSPASRSPMEEGETH